MSYGVVRGSGPAGVVRGTGPVVSGQISRRPGSDAILRAHGGIVHAAGSIVEGPRNIYSMAGRRPVEAFRFGNKNLHEVPKSQTTVDELCEQAVSQATASKASDKLAMSAASQAAPPAAFLTAAVRPDTGAKLGPATFQGELLKLPDVSRGKGRAQNQMVWGGMGEQLEAFAWIRRDNSQAARAARRDISALTRQVVEAGGYTECGKAQELQHVEKMKNGTIMLARSLGNAKGPTDQTRFRGTKLIAHPPTTVLLQAALQLLGRHRKDGVAVVSAASAYHCGGGFLSGGRHALEEALCVQTSLYASISQAHEEFLDYCDDESAPYIPADGVILSPYVEFFREGSDQGYAFMDQPELLKAIISVAMFNRNPRVRDAPLDAPRDPKEYEREVREKLRSVLCAAVACKCSALVMPDAGCGVYMNDPAILGRIFGDLLRREFWGHIQEVALCGHPEFQKAVQERVAAIEKDEEARR